MFEIGTYVEIAENFSTSGRDFKKGQVFVVFSYRQGWIVLTNKAKEFAVSVPQYLVKRRYDF